MGTSSWVGVSPDKGANRFLCPAENCDRHTGQTALPVCSSSCRRVLGDETGLPAGSAVEGEHDGIKNGGFPGSRISGNEIESMGQPVEVNGGFLCIGAEGSHFQQNRFHTPLSCFSANFRSSSACRSRASSPRALCRTCPPTKRKRACACSSGAAPPKRSL